MQDVYKDTKEYNLGQKLKVLVFDDMIADMVNEKKTKSISD